MKNQIQYKNKKFNMNELQNIIYGLVTKCRKILVKRLMKMNKMEKKKEKLPMIL